MFSGAFRKHGVFPLAIVVHIYKEGDIVNIKGTGTVHKGMPVKVTVAKPVEYAVLPSMLLALM